MRRLIFIRHGEPAFPDGQRLCLGRTDLPLSTPGRLQACVTGWALRGERLCVYTSPLRRARETAALLTPLPTVLEGLTEADMGAWDALPFSAIKRRWPEEYAGRGKDLSQPPPGGETSAAVLARFTEAVQAALKASDGDLALVTHAQSMDLFLASALGRSFEEQRAERLPYGTYRVLRTDGTRYETVAGPERPELCRELCLALLDAAQTPERVKAHCEAVAAQALKIARALPLALDLELLENAALLHDLARTQNDHAAVGAAWLRALGYEAEAALVEQHHDWPGGPIDEAAVLVLADQCVQGTELVPLEQRFAASREKCRTPEALAAHGRRYQTALFLKREVNRLCRQEIIR